MQQTNSENNGGSILLDRMQTRSCKKLSLNSESQKRHLSCQRLEICKKQRRMSHEYNTLPETISPNTQGIVGDSQKTEHCNAANEVQPTSNTSRLTEPLSQGDDHDLTPYLMETSDDEMERITKNTHSTTEDVSGVDMQIKGKNRIRNTGNWKKPPIKKNLKSENRNSHHSLRIENEQLQHKLNEQLNKNEILEGIIEKMKDGKPTFVKKCNDINIYGGRCNMQVGDSSLLQAGDQNGDQTFEKRFEAQLNRIESELAEVKANVVSIKAFIDSKNKNKRFNKNRNSTTDNG